MNEKINLESLSECIIGMRIVRRGIDGLKHMYGWISNAKLVNDNEMHIQIKSNPESNEYDEIYLSIDKSDYEKLEKIDSFRYSPEDKYAITYEFKTNWNRIYEIFS